MHRTLALVILLSLLTIHESPGQWLMGFAGGGALNYRLPAGSGLALASTHPGVGYHAGFSVQGGLGRRLNLRSGLHYLTKNHSVHQSGPGTGAYQQHRNTYLQLPVLLQVVLARYQRIEVCASTGGFAGYWLAGRVKGRVPNLLDTFTTLEGDGQPFENLQWAYFNEPYRYDRTRDNRCEAGLTGSLGIVCRFSATSRLFLEGELYQALTGGQRSQALNTRVHTNLTFLLSAGGLLQIR
ncbi:MAG: outer membrane beta-barrel protein [Cytophagales bacterium]|nr:outer membrane beta-barrel protein [Cytophagales bacterium]